MSMRQFSVIGSLFVILFFACGTRNVSDLSYTELREKIFAGQYGEFIEWHGETLDLRAQNVLLMGNGEACGGEDCGEMVKITNLSDGQVEAVIQNTHPIQGIHSSFARKILIPAKRQIYLNCSHFCYQGKKYPLTTKIIGAKPS